MCRIDALAWHYRALETLTLRFAVALPSRAATAGFLQRADSGGLSLITAGDRRTDRLTDSADRAQRRCLLTNAPLRHGISFQLDAPADLPGLIMKPLDVGRFLIMEHSAGQIRFVMTAALFMKGSSVCYWKNNNQRLSMHQPPAQRCWVQPVWLF